MKKYDMIIIGTGAGNIILEAALEQGLRCAQIERGKFGGTCLTRGCIPTKVMATFADKLIEMKEAKEIGISCENIRFDWDLMSKRVWEKIDESKELRDFYKNTENLDVYEGTGYFVEDKVIEVELNDGTISKRITADKIFIGVGGRTNVPKLEGLEEVGYLTSETLFGEKYPERPYDSLIIIGGGAIGTEFAHIFNAVGTKVSMVQRNVRLLPKEDEEVSSLIMECYKERGIDLYLNTNTVLVKKHGSKKMLTIEDKTTGERKNLVADEILVAPGIVSNSDLIKIQNTSIATDERGWIKTNEFLETNVEDVWAFGDVNGRQQFRHKANYEADIIAHNCFMNKMPEDYRWARYDLVPAVTFCYPQVAHVGMTEKAAKEAGHSIEVGKHLYNQTAKGFALGYEKNDNEFAKIIIDKKTKKILGFHAIGHEAAMLIQPYLNLMNAGETVLQPINEEIGSETTKRLRQDPPKRALDPNLLTTVRETMVPHPALSEVGIWVYYYLTEA
ncbi:MAG: FAD-dependent oxidoreductase [Peptostreptococcaceae bacterium]|nr:FAD-dependent oxidoreductase [Peptostreptococcaceae bacterium]